MQTHPDRRTRPCDPDPERVRRLRELAEGYLASKRALAKVLAEIDASGAFRRLGYASVQEFARQEYGLTDDDLS